MTATKPITGVTARSGVHSAPPDRTILVADDSRTVLRLVERTLRDAGYRVVLAENGRQAVDAALQAKPDLVILDINMPVLDGYGVCHELLVNETWDASTPVIFLTCVDAPHLETLGSQLGAFLPKPTDRDLLLDAVESLLRRTA